MKTNSSIASSLNARLSGVVMRDEVKAAVLNQVRGEKKHMKRKISAAAVFALAALLLMTGVAVAASAGVFEFFAQKNDAAQELMNALSQNAVNIGDTQTVPADGAFPAATFTMDQAFYDGEALYLSYILSGAEAVKEEGYVPTAEEQKNMERWEEDWLPDELAGYGNEKPWGVTIYTTYPGDGLYDAESGEYLCPSMGNEDVIDGALMSYFRFERPLPDAFRNKEALNLYYKLYRSANSYYFDGETLWVGYARQALNLSPVRIPKAHENAVLTASEKFDEYHAFASVSVSQVDIRAEILLTQIPDSWKQDWETLDQMDCDFPYDYALVINGKEAASVEGELQDAPDGIKYVFTYSRPESIQELRLRPIYKLSGPHENEDLVIVP